MAVTLNFIDRTIHPIYNDICMGLTITDIGTYPELKTIVYYYTVYDSVGNVLYQTDYNEVYAPVNGFNHEFHLEKELQPLLFTSMPNPNTIGAAPVITNDPNIWDSVTLNWGENIHNLETCSSAINWLGSQGLEIINSGEQIYEDGIVTPRLILDHSPSVIQTCKGNIHWLWVLGTGPISFTSNVGFFSATLANKVNIVSINQFGPNPDIVEWIRVAVGATTKTFVFQDCCCEDEDKNTGQILYLDPLGGRQTMPFCIEEYEMATDNEIICSYKNCNLPADQNNYSKGKTIVNKKSTERITFTNETANDDENREWFKAFLSSSGYHVLTNNNGIKQYRKFILESGSVTYSKKNDVLQLSVRGYYSENYNNHRLDI